MSKTALVVLALLALGLGGYIVLFERTSVTSSELQGRTGRVLTSFVRDKVERLTIQRKGIRVVLTRNKLTDGSPSSFQVREPFVAKADDDVVDRLLGELEWLSARRTLEAVSVDDLRTFGLSAPRYRVGFEAGGVAHTLAIGHADVHGDAVYVRVDDDKRAYVVPRTVTEVLEHEPGDYRDKQLFPDLTVAWASKLTLHEGEAQHALHKDAARWWTQDEPPSYADEKRVDELLHALSELRATRYLDAAQQEAALPSFTPSTLHLEVVLSPPAAREDQKARSYTLELGGACAGHADEHYLRGSVSGGAAIVGCVGDAELKPFMLGDDSLRERRLFSSDVHTIERFVLTREKEKLALSRDGEKWKAQGPAEQSGPVDREAVEAWLADLSAARASSFEPVGSFVERGSLTLELMPKKSERIAIGDLTADGTVQVKRGDEAWLASFPGSVFDRLWPSKGRFQSLEVWASHQPSEVSKIDARSGALSRVLTLSEGTWRSSGPVDSDRVRELVRDLLDLRARAYLSAEARPAHGFANPSARVELTLSRGKPLTLELGSPTDRGAYARIDGHAVVEVGSETMLLLNELAGGPRIAVAHDEDDEEESGHDHAH